MNEEDKNLSPKKLPTEDAKTALKGALKGIPKSLLLKVFYYFSVYLLYIIKLYCLDSS